MSAALGSLVVSLAADTVSFQDSLTKAAYTTSQTMGQIASSVESVAGRFQFLQHAVEALVFSEAIRGMSDFVTGAIAAQARLQDLGVMAGATAAQMSALIPAATLSGTNMENVASAAEHLERNLSPMSKNAAAAQNALAALGFSAEDAKRFLADPTEGLYELAQRLNAFADDGNKTAVIMALMGRSAGEMLPFLKQLGEQSQLTATLINEQTRAAHDLTDQWNALKISGDELKNTIASALVPALSQVLTAFTDAFGGADSLGAKIKELADDGDLARWALEGARDVAVLVESLLAIGGVIGGLVADLRVLYDVGAQAIAGIAALMALMAEGSGSDAFAKNMERVREANDDLQRDVARDNEAWTNALSEHRTALSDALNAEIEKLNSAASQYQVAWAAMAPPTSITQGFDFSGGIFGSAAGMTDVARAISNAGSQKPHLDVSQAGKVDTTFVSEMDALAAAAAKANIEMAKLLDPQPMTTAEEAFAAFVASDKWDKLTIAEKNATTAKEMLVEATERHLSLLQAEAADQALATQQSIAAAVAYGDEATASGAIGAAQDAANTSIGTMLQSMQLQAQTAGMDSQATQELAFEMAMLHAGIEKGSDLWDNYLAAYEKWANDAAQGKAAVQAAHDAEQAWKQAAQSISQDLITAFDDWVHGAKNLGQQLRDELLKMFDSLILRPKLQPVAGGIASMFMGGSAGASGGGATDVASQLFGGGGSSSALSGISDLTSLGGDFSSIAAIGQTISAFPTMVSAFGADLSVVGASGSLASIGGFSGLVAGAAPIALPIIAAFAIADALGAFKHGGPKTGGFGETGTDFGRFYTPNNDDSTMATLANTTLTSYNSLLSSLGGTGSANFGFGFDEDPNGTANSRVSAGATVNGKRVYDVLNQDAGRGDKGVQADLQLDAQRAILAALQASNLPQDIAHILDSIVPSSASADQIQQVEAMASAYGDLSKEISANPLSDALADLTAKAQGAYGAFIAEGAAYSSLLKTYDGSTAATQALDKASQDYYASLVQLMEQIQQVKQSIDSMFGDDVRNFRLQSLDKQGQYAFYQSEAAADLKQIGTATDPTVVQTLEKQISDDLNAAFGLLDPTQQAAMLSRYISGAAAAQAAGDTRLTALGANASTQFTDAAKQAQQALTDAANKMHDAATTIAAAATTQTTAANTALRAAQTPVTLNVNVNGTTAAEVNIG